MLTLKWSDHLEILRHLTFHAIFDVVRTSRWPQWILYLVTSGVRASEAVHSVLVHGGAQDLPLTVLVRVQHVLGGHEVVVWCIMRRRASSDKTGDAIVLPITRIEILLVVKW